DHPPALRLLRVAIRSPCNRDSALRGPSPLVDGFDDPLLFAYCRPSRSSTAIVSSISSFSFLSCRSISFFKSISDFPFPTDHASSLRVSRNPPPPRKTILSTRNIGPRKRLAL